jgi:putative transposase
MAYSILEWLKKHRVKTLYNKPGSLWEDGYIDSLHDMLRDECLSSVVFGNSPS